MQERLERELLAPRACFVDGRPSVLFANLSDVGGYLVAPLAPLLSLQGQAAQKKENENTKKRHTKKGY